MNHPTPWTESRPARKIVSEEEFRPLLASQAHDLLLLANGFLELTPEQWTQRQLYHLFQASTDLETYLDDYGAKENRKFFRCRELVAILRWTSNAMSGLVHLHARSTQYQVCDRKLVDKLIDPQVRHSALGLGESIIRCLKALRSFWQELGMVWPDAALRVESLGAGGPSYRLMRDLADLRKESEHSAKAAKIAGRFLYLAKSLDENKPYVCNDPDELREIMGKYCREEQCRRFEARVHNFQSAYDNQISGSETEQNNPELRQLRGTASIALHLFEAATALSHLYGRHNMSTHFDDTDKLIMSELELSKIVVNTCAVGAYLALESAKKSAQEQIEQHTEATTVTLAIPDGLILHARPISLIVGIVNHHRVPVEAEIEGHKCSAASIMQMLVLAGSHSNHQSINFSGDNKVLAELEMLFAAALGEEGFDKLPPELQYLIPSGD